MSELFFDEFSDHLERTSTYASSLIIVGDLNIHLDVTSDSAAVMFLNIIDQHSLVQHVIGATHRAGHCLDVFITKKTIAMVHILSYKSIVIIFCRRRSVQVDCC